MATQSYDPRYVEAYMGISLVLAVAVAFVLLLLARGQVRPLKSRMQKLFVAAAVVTFMGLCTFAVLAMELNPSAGNWRANVLHELATSSRFGTFVTINVLGSWSLIWLLFGTGAVLLAPVRSPNSRERSDAHNVSDV